MYCQELGYEASHELQLKIKARPCSRSKQVCVLSLYIITYTYDLLIMQFIYYKESNRQHCTIHIKQASISKTLVKTWEKRCKVQDRPSGRAQNSDPAELFAEPELMVPGLCWAREKRWQCTMYCLPG